MKIFFYIICLLGISNFIQAQSRKLVQVANCAGSSAKIDLDINNVRATILSGGDMWWDLANAKYEVPKGSGKNSIFAGALWIGGIDQNGQIHVAAQTYRQSGSDYYPGPIDTTSATTDSAECRKYDRLWKISRQEVENFKNGGPATPAILSWPGNGDLSRNEAHYLAPFHDANGDGLYNANDGDYPEYDFMKTNNSCYHKLLGEQTIWWVFNDVGNVHKETKGLPLGFEIRAQAFAYTSADQVNDASFYQYQMINRSSNTYEKVYAGIWCDADLGFTWDDYIGCDVSRGLAYAYNGDSFDEDSTGYGSNLAAVGIDFLEGPRADIGDGVDNNLNGYIDEAGEDICMSNFLMYQNTFGDNGNPTTPSEYYNYLKGIWKDGTPITHGGNGFHGSIPSHYMYSGTTDPAFSSDWTETTAGNAPGDSRFLTSVGPFTMAPGAVNYMTTAVVWARANGINASINHLKVADDVVQAAFNACFQGVGINELNSKNLIEEVSIFPNPFQDKATLKFRNEAGRKYEFKLFSMEGLMLMHIQNMNEAEIELHRSILPAGIYLYQLSDDKGKSTQGKVVMY